VQEFLAVTVGTIALSSFIDHSIDLALSVVMQSQTHHQCVCGFTVFERPAVSKDREGPRRLVGINVDVFAGDVEHRHHILPEWVTTGWSAMLRVCPFVLICLEDPRANGGRSPAPTEEGHFAAHIRGMRDIIGISGTRLSPQSGPVLGDHLSVEPPDQGISLRTRGKNFPT
jgi:hypothetical protein